MLRPVVSTSGVMDGVTSEGGFVLWSDSNEVTDFTKGGATFEIGFKTSFDAFFMTKHLPRYYVKNSEGGKMSRVNSRSSNFETT